MEISKNEEIMYEVMEAIHDSGIPISFKGSLVLKAVLIENGYGEETRHTVDIDGNWISHSHPTMETMSSSIQKAIDKKKLNLLVSPFREYGVGRSAGFAFTSIADKSREEVIFTMDIDVDRPVTETRIYEVKGFSFSGMLLANMLADKIVVISSEKIFRRIKDLIDVFYLSRIAQFDKDEILSVISRNGKAIGNFDAFLNRQDDLRHAYMKYRLSGDVHKPSFEEIYEEVRNYLGVFLSGPLPDDHP